MISVAVVSCFLQVLINSCASLKERCDAIGISQVFWYIFVLSNPSFAALIRIFGIDMSPVVATQHLYLASLTVVVELSLVLALGLQGR